MVEEFHSELEPSNKEAMLCTQMLQQEWYSLPKEYAHIDKDYLSTCWLGLFLWEFGLLCQEVLSLVSEHSLCACDA